MKIINLIRERISEDELWVDTFLAEDWVNNPEEALRNAVTDFLKTEQGLESMKESFYDYNWGDFVNDVPKDILSKYGLAVSDSHLETINIKVNQDEILCDNIDIPYSIVEDNGYVIVADDIRINLNIINEDFPAERIEEIIKNELGENLKDIYIDEVVSILKSDYNCISVN